MTGSEQRATSAQGSLGHLELPPVPRGHDGSTGERGWFIVFEGTDGSGKSTQAELLAGRTGALLTRQPGGTRLGEVLRDITLGGSAGEVTDRAEALLMAADRAQHVESVIRPALSEGRAVVCDRYLGSSIAYQGHGRGLDPETIRRISMWACDGLLPDVVVNLEVTRDVAVARTGSPRDRIEAGGDGFHDRVRGGFRHLAAEDPNWVTVDGSAPVEVVGQRVAEAVVAKLAAA